MVYKCTRNPNRSKRPTGNHRLEFTFKEAVLDFCNWLKFDILSSLSTPSLPTPHPKDNPTQYWFSCCNHPYFTEISKLWYVETGNKRTKVLPNMSYLDENFSAVSLAHWIMGDGYWEHDGKTVYLCTECFTPDEVKVLVKLLEVKLGLIAGLKARGNSYRIRFSRTAQNLNLLRSLVTPHMHPSMMYKLHPTKS